MATERPIESVAAFGPFHRLESPTQTDEVARLQELTGEIWGTIPRSGGWPQVQAYRGPLPKGQRGIEFFTSVAPDGGGPVCRWAGGGRRPDVRTEDDYAKIECIVVKNTQTIGAD